MPNALYPLLLVFVFLVIVTAVLKTDLLGYVSAVCIIFAFMVVLHHYAALGVMGDALQVQNPYLRYFLLRSAVTVGGVAPLRRFTAKAIGSRSNRQGAGSLRAVSLSARPIART